MDLPTTESVWESHGTEKTVICPECDQEAFRFVPNGVQTDIDTIGRVTICSTEHGTFFHGNR